MTDDERLLIDTARQLGLGHMLMPGRYWKTAPTSAVVRALCLELYWRAVRRVRSWFPRRRPASLPDVASMRAQIQAARRARLGAA